MTIYSNIIGSILVYLSVPVYKIVCNTCARLHAVTLYFGQFLTL